MRRTWLLSWSAAACSVLSPLAFAPLASADEAKPVAGGATSAEADPASVVPDVMRDAVDPYVPGKERARFLKVAGVDTELDEAEFKGAAEAGKAGAAEGFVRKFDSWGALAAFDRNQNGRIDWFEAESYRKALRAAVVRLYDKDQDLQLARAERDAANRDLAAGKAPKLAAPTDKPDTLPGTTAKPGIPGTPATEERPGRRPGQRRDEFVQRFDKDGDGKLSDEERHAAGEVMLKEGRQRQIDKYDKDGDGKLSEAERAEALKHEQDQWWLRVDDLGMKHFDKNGNGLLDDDEAHDMSVFGQQLEGMGKAWELKLLDTDGDGKISEQERREMQQRMSLVGLNMFQKGMRWLDTDGDGRVSDEERKGVIVRAAAAAQESIGKWTQRFDGNGDGKLDDKERTALIQGINEDIAARIKRHHKAEGPLSAAAVEAIADELAEEYGIKPKGK